MGEILILLVHSGIGLSIKGWINKFRNWIIIPEFRRYTHSSCTVIILVRNLPRSYRIVKILVSISQPVEFTWIHSHKWKLFASSQDLRRPMPSGHMYHICLVFYSTSLICLDPCLLNLTWNHQSLEMLWGGIWILFWSSVENWREPSQNGQLRK